MSTHKLCVYAEAPGKVILFGEHFVVCGRPAIAAAISLRARAIVCPGSRGVVVFSDGMGILEEVWPSEPKAFANFRAVVEAVGRIVGRRPWPSTIKLSSDIPVGAGLGSSAATSVALAAAYAALGSASLTVEQISCAAYEGEKVVHGKPSGIDNTISAFGGFALYRQGRLERIAAKLSGVKLVIADSGLSRRTREAVEKVLARKRKLGPVGERVYDLAESVVLEARRALEAGDAVKLGELMDFNHGLLNAMGVSLPILEELVHAARTAGALGAKITGAGLGGSIIALVWQDDVKKVAEALKRKAKRVFVVNVGVEGVKWRAVEETQLLPDRSLH